MKFSTFLIKPERIWRAGENYPQKWEDCTGVKPTDIFGVDKGGDFIIVSRETWKRIELFAEVLSAVDMNISKDKLNEILQEALGRRI